MPLCPACLLVLGAALGGCCGSHSLYYFYLRATESSSEQEPRFFIWGNLDDQPITHFDSLTGKVQPLVSWMEKETFLPLEWVFRSELEKLSRLNHPTDGLHTWQVILGCELWEDGSKGGWLRYGYDGMDFLSFEKETLRWVAAQPQARKVKEKWEEDSGWSHKTKVYLEETCIEWLQRYLSYGKEAVKKTEPPVGKVTHKAMSDSLEVFTCQAFGFYPKEIQATWTRDGENWEQETYRRNVAPNSDGTYYVWISIEIDPKERDLFRCHLEHNGMQKPLVLAFQEETATWWWILMGIVATGAAAILFLICKWWRHRTILYQEVGTSPGNFPLETDSLSSTPDTEEDEIQLESMLQSVVTTEDRESHEWLRSRWALEAPMFTLHRREGKKQGLKTSQSWAGDLGSLDKEVSTLNQLSWPKRE